MRLTTGLAFIAGIAVATWLSSLDRAARYQTALQVTHCQKADRE